MPRVLLNRRKYILTDLYRYIRGEMAIRNITHEKLGFELGCSQQAVSAKFKRMSFSVPDLIAIFDYFETPNEKVAELLKGKK